MHYNLARFVLFSFVSLELNVAVFTGKVLCIVKYIERVSRRFQRNERMNINLYTYMPPAQKKMCIISLGTRRRRASCRFAY